MEFPPLSPCSSSKQIPSSAIHLTEKQFNVEEIVSSNDNDDEADKNTNGDYVTVESAPSSLNQTVSESPKSIDKGKRILVTKKKRVSKVSRASTSSSSSALHRGGSRVARRLRNRRRGEKDFQALALPLGMSIAAVIVQVLERKNVAGGTIPADDLSMICSSAVKESVENVFGDRVNCFLRNFEQSFHSTLKTLRFINEASFDGQGDPLWSSDLKDYQQRDISFSSDIRDYLLDGRRDTSFSSDIKDYPLNGQRDTVFSSNIKGYALDRQRDPICSSGIKDCSSEILPTFGSSSELPSTFEEVQKNTQLSSVNYSSILHEQLNQQLAPVSRTTSGSGCSQSILSTIEKSVMEQVRSNDLKEFEIALIMKRLQMKESQLALTSDANLLERFKISMGISKASFKKEKLKNQTQDTKHAELLRKCIDCLVAGLLIMIGCLVYGTYVYSYKRITEATSSCASLPKERKSWWVPNPVSSFSSVVHMLRCHVQVLSRMLFGVFMILAIAYLLLQRSAASRQTMPVTFILLLLGFACGFAGKICVDALGGSGYHWLLYWEALCLLHFFANVFPSALFCILHGPVSVAQGTEKAVRLPYWIRRFTFYSLMLLFLPVLCGLMPFASPLDWKEHFSSLAAEKLF